MEELDLLKSQGNEYFKMGSYESALETYFKCLESIEMDSKDEKDDQNDDAEIRTTLNVNIAAVYMKIKDWAKCVEYASKALVSDPEDKTQLKWKAMYRRGVALKHLKRYPQAAAELTIVLKLKPDYAKAKKHLESIRKLMKPPLRMGCCKSKTHDPLHEPKHKTPPHPHAFEAPNPNLSCHGE